MELDWPNYPKEGRKKVLSEVPPFVKTRFYELSE